MARPYRLAGITGEEFGALLRVQTQERGRLLVHLRRKPIMRLRAGFDGCDGGVFDEGVLTRAALRFRDGNYMEGEGTVHALGPFPTALLVTGALNRPLGHIVRSAPRRVAGLRARSIGQGRWGVELDVRNGFEALAPMPAHVAAELGIEEQRHLGHLPWADPEGPAPGLPAANAPNAPIARAAGPTARAATRPKLRLVASS